MMKPVVHNADALDELPLKNLPWNTRKMNILLLDDFVFSVSYR